MSENSAGRMSGIEARIDELESRQVFQDDVIENLNRVVTRQDKEIIDLKQQVAALSEQVKEYDISVAATVPSSGFEPPPHY